MDNTLFYMVVGAAISWVPGLLIHIFDFIKTQAAAKRAERKEKETLRRAYLQTRVDEIRNYVKALSEAIAETVLTDERDQKMSHNVDEGLPYWIARESYCGIVSELGRPELEIAVVELMSLATDAETARRKSPKQIDPTERNEIRLSLFELVGDIYAELDWVIMYSQYPVEKPLKPKRLQNG